MFQAGLVLEGGGMRGVYTAGVLDYFQAQGAEFESIYGVSAGAIQGCSFLSRQPGRGYACIVDYMDDWRYLSVRSLLLTGNLFGVKMCYDTIPNQLNLFDYETYAKNPSTLYAVLTDVKTGQPVYRAVRDMHQDTIVIRASASLPFVSHAVKIDGRKMLDGGVTDSIPLQKALDDGFRRTVVVLTQDETYRKHPSSMAKLGKLRYPRSKAFREALETRHERYNQQLALVQQMEAEGKAFVIRPQQPVAFSRVEKDKAKLQALYEAGMQDAQRLSPALLSYLHPTAGKPEREKE